MRGVFGAPFSRKGSYFMVISAGPLDRRNNFNVHRRRFMMSLCDYYSCWLLLLTQSNLAVYLRGSGDQLANLTNTLYIGSHARVRTKSHQVSLHFLQQLDHCSSQHTEPCQVQPIIDENTLLSESLHSLSP